MLELTIRLVVSLAIVVGLLLVLARVGARKFRGGSEALVHVVHRQPLSRTSAVAVVTVGTRVLVLGTTEQQISVLAELDPDEIEGAEVIELDGLTVVEDDLQVPVALQAITAPAPVRAPGSHRAAPAAKAAKVSASSTNGGALAGSILSAQTWKQAFNAARRAS
ncbi:flagellar protein FliO/FliZ [Marmoricola sp. OAE513]|uniref:FliO/MopB family protein n=1 Tax=Marmoricola sp. OAE513 TaxID=2817894 RepID=UPI001AE3565F